MFLYFVMLLCANIEPSLFDRLIVLSENSENIILNKEDYLQELNSVDATMYVDVFNFAIKITMLSESQSIPRVIYECIGFKNFTSENSFLNTLSEDFKKLTNLEYLILNNNNFTKISNVIFSLINLKKLEMNENNIKMISSNIKHLKQLEILRLEKNYIIRIPTGFNELTNLIDLNLSHNIELFVPNIFTTLENKHTDFFNMINTLNLRVLYLNDTGLQLIPEDFRFKNLEEFHANNNKLNIIDMNTLKDCSLRKIFLDNNNFKKFPMNILTINSIELIVLDSNNIQKVNIKDMIFPNLICLTLNHNQIKDFYMCANAVPSLKVLGLNGNNIKNFIMDSRDVSCLEELYLRKNNISVFDNKLTGFKNLKLLNLRENDICMIGNLNDISDQEITLKLQVECLGKIKNLICTRRINKVSVSCKIKTKNESRLNIFEKYTEENDIKIMNLEFCHLENIPEGIEKLISVENLSFKNNNLTKVYNCFKDLKSLKLLDFSYNKIDFIDSDILLLESLEILDFGHNCLKYFPSSIKYFNHKKLKIKWAANEIFLFGNESNLGWMEIPPHYASTIKIGYSEKYFRSNMAIGLYTVHFKDIYQWDIKRIAQIISNEPDDEYLPYSEIIELWNSYLKPHITAENIIESIENYINALYKLNNIIIPYITGFTLKQYDTIKTYLTAVFKFIKDKDPYQIENICTSISQETLFCYDAQYEILQHIYISLKTGESFDITYFIKEIIYKIKYDILLYIVTSNINTQNVHGLAYWRNELSEEIGFIKNESKYTYNRSKFLVDNKEYILYQFFLLFKAEKVATEILEKINKSGNFFLCLASQFIVEHETEESKLEKYMEFNSIDLLDIRSITNEGVIFIMEVMELFTKEI